MYQGFYFILFYYFFKFYFIFKLYIIVLVLPFYACSGDAVKAYPFIAAAAAAVSL